MAEKWTPGQADAEIVKHMPGQSGFLPQRMSIVVQIQQENQHPEEDAEIKILLILILVEHTTLLHLHTFGFLLCPCIDVP